MAYVCPVFLFPKDMHVFPADAPSAMHNARRDPGPSHLQGRVAAGAAASEGAAGGGGGGGCISRCTRPCTALSILSCCAWATVAAARAWASCVTLDGCGRRHLLSFRKTAVLKREP